MQSSVFFLAVLTVSFGYVSAIRVKWDGLKVKFGSFIDLPRTVEDALSKNFTKISDCNPNAPWRGNRYIQNQERSLALLFDVNGYIAGIQISIPKLLPSGFPTINLQPPFLSDGDFWVITAYFVRPALRRMKILEKVQNETIKKYYFGMPERYGGDYGGDKGFNIARSTGLSKDKICNPGRSKKEFDTYGTGRDLYIQNSTLPETSTRIPKVRRNLAGTSWTKGKCFPAMGTHYWWNFSKGIACNSLSPWFLMYNGGKLRAFGFAFAANLTSSIFERPTRDSYQLFMNPVPQCLLTDGGVINTLHVYLTRNASQITCNAISPTTGG